MESRMFVFLVSLGVLAGGSLIVSHLLGNSEQAALAAGKPGATIWGVSARPLLTTVGILASVFLAPFWWPLGVLGLIAALGAQYTPLMAAIRAKQQNPQLQNTGR